MWAYYHNTCICRRWQTLSTAPASEHSFRIKKKKIAAMENTLGRRLGEIRIVFINVVMSKDSGYTVLPAHSSEGSKLLLEKFLPNAVMRPGTWQVWSLNVHQGHHKLTPFAWFHFGHQITIDPWTIQRLGVLTPQAVENPWITFDSSKTTTNSLLLIGSITNNINSRSTGFVICYMYYILDSHNKIS